MVDNLGLRFDLSSLEAHSICRRHRAEPFSVVAPALRDDVREMARRGWEDRTRSEYTGVMIVRHFHGLLVDLNAPMDLQELGLSMMLQEQQHAQYCAAAARSLGSDGEIAFALDELQIKRTDQPLSEQLWDMVIGTYCCGELVAHVLLRHCLQALPKGPYKDILRAIARDEVLHSKIGSLILESVRNEEAPKWIEYPGDGWVISCAENHLKHLLSRDVIEDDERAMFEDEDAAEQLRSVGIPPSDPFKEAYLHGVNVVAPKAFAKIGLELTLT